MKRICCLLTLICLISYQAFSAQLYIPMDEEDQTDHLKAYGIAFLALQSGLKVDWLLNYDGGAFACPDNSALREACQIRNVSFKILPDVQYAAILEEIAHPDFNGTVMQLEKVPKIAVYTPPGKRPWDDAVTMALTYAEIPYDKLYDTEILKGDLPKYDWLHLHHEDFTGQFGKFWGAYRNADWYIQEVAEQKKLAQENGFRKVSELKLAVVKKIRDFVAGGGYMFAMCSAPDTYDVALAADGVDICAEPFDGDPMDPNAQAKLNYDNCFAFTDFKLQTNPAIYEVSDIDNTIYRRVDPRMDYFNLFIFSAKSDPVPTMLCQNHTTTIKGFMGQATSFKFSRIKSNVVIMGDNQAAGEARYIHGEYGKGTWTFYAGHDPEDYRHLVGDPPTDLSLHPNSPGYRLILNNVLFPAAKRKPRKT